MMKLTPKFIQCNCVEGDKIDPRQGLAVLKYRPDIIIFESPMKKGGPDMVFNKYSCDKKPLKKVDEIIKNCKISAKEFPYAESGVAVWENIKRLWAKGNNVQLYEVDTPQDLRREHFLMHQQYPECRKDPLFWSYLYIRDKTMTKNIKLALDNYSGKKDPVVAIFLQSIHWKHVQFLMKDPTPSEIWKYYFGRFPKLTKDDIKEILSKRSKVLAQYWKKETNALWS
jgi:hypothetical protein